MIQEKTLMPGVEYRASNGAGITLQSVANSIRERANYYGAPLAIQTDQLRTGGMLLGEKEDCLVLSHPDKKMYLRYVVRVRSQGRYAFVTVDKTNGFNPNSSLGGGLEAGRAAAKGKARQEEDGWYLILDDIFEELFK